MSIEGMITMEILKQAQQPSRKPEGDNEVSQILNEREKTHGNFTDNANISQSLKAVMRATKNWNQLTNIQQEALEMVAHKIGRILAGDPDIVDHWIDGAGYLELVAERIPLQKGEAVSD